MVYSADFVLVAVSALNGLYTSLNSASQLTGWISSGGDPCGESWRGITCSGSAVTEIKLSGMGLTGSLGYNMNSMTSLIELDMSNNNIGGGNQIPYSLPPNLQRLNLAGNSFNGGIPYSISQMVSLKTLNLNHNQLQGSLNDMFGKLSNLSTMDISFNDLSGDLPESLSSLSSLATLYLQNNRFTGTIDVLASLPLEDLNVANNQFTGWIPDRLKGMNNLQTGGNSWSTAPAPPPPPGTPPTPARRTNPGHRSGVTKKPSNDVDSGKSSGGIGGGAISGIIVFVIVLGAFALFLIRRRLKKSPNSSEEKRKEDRQPVLPHEVKEMKPFQPPPATNTTLQSSEPISLKPPPIDQSKSFEENDFSSKPSMKKINASHIKATIYSVADLQMATESFSADNLVGEGATGRVYRAHFNDGKVLAVKKINSTALPNQSTENFIEVVSKIAQFHHPNVTKLVGYCFEHGQHLLVYEFHKNGTLQDLLHILDEYSKPLTWNTRVKIALGMARALEYLHEVCSPSVIHRNFKSANILLDAELNPHLSECGLASFVPDVGYQTLDHSLGCGYSAPEVAMSGQYSLKSDVYSFGVVMLELLTGRKPFDSSKPRSEQSLVRWATPQLHDIDALDKMVDPALEGLYPAKALSRFADVIALCVQPEPEFRPPMSEVVQALVRLVQRAHMSKRTRSRDRLEDPPQADDQDAQQDFA